MRLTYKCLNCGAVKDLPVPHQPGVTAEDILANFGGTPTKPCLMVRPWIRHPCDAHSHGIANLVAITEDSPTTYQPSAAPGGDTK